METRSIKYYATCLIAVTGLLLACEKEPALPDKPVYPAGSNEAANQWMLDSLRRYYFWNTSLPGNPALDKEPQAFFRSVLHNDDRFSLLFDPNDGATLTPSLRTRYGFELSVLETGGRIVGVVTLVLKQSPAERAGLKRGDILIQLNGKPFTKENAATLPVEFASGSSGTAVRATYAGGIWNEEEPLTIGMMYTFEHQDKYTVLDVNGTKVGYYFILSFNETGTYSLLQAFGEFKQAGVQEMVIDLRYNYGGKVSSSAALGAMLAPGISSNSPFITYNGTPFLRTGSCRGRAGNGLQPDNGTVVKPKTGLRPHHGSDGVGVGTDPEQPETLYGSDTGRRNHLRQGCSLVRNKRPAQSARSTVGDASGHL